jgi:hypothetical protein
MKLLIAILLATAALSSPTHAIYTECTLQNDIDAATRPNGFTVPRWKMLEKGEKVAIRETHQNWVFVHRWIQGGRGGGGHAEYGWVPRNTLLNYQAREGTPP